MEMNDTELQFGTNAEEMQEKPLPRPQKKIGVLMIVVVVLFLVVSVAVVMGFELLHVDTEGTLWQIITTAAITIGVVLLPSLIHIFAKRNPGDKYNLGKLRANQILPCILLGTGFCFAMLVVENIIQAAYMSAGVDLGLLDDGAFIDTSSIGGFLLTTLCIAVAPAVCEELLCRSAVLYSFRSLGMHLSALLSGLFFAFLHLNLTSLPVYVAIGYCFGLIAYKTRSVYSTMIVHFVYNFSIICLQALPLAEETAGETLSLASGELWVAVGIFAVVAAAFLIPAIIIFRKNCYKNDIKDAEAAALTPVQYDNEYNDIGVGHAKFGMIGVVFSFIILALTTMLTGISQIQSCIVK